MFVFVIVFSDVCSLDRGMAIYFTRLVKSREVAFSHQKILVFFGHHLNGFVFYPIFNNSLRLSILMVFIFQYFPIF